MLKCNVSQLLDDLQYLGEENPPRTERELFYPPHPQIVSAGITLYTIALNDWRLPAKLPFKDIQRLYSKIAGYDWQMVNELPVDSEKIVAAAKRFWKGGAA